MAHRPAPRIAVPAHPAPIHPVPIRPSPIPRDPARLLPLLTLAILTAMGGCVDEEAAKELEAKAAEVRKLEAEVKQAKQDAKAARAEAMEFQRETELLRKNARGGVDAITDLKTWVQLIDEKAFDPAARSRIVEAKPIEAFDAGATAMHRKISKEITRRLEKLIETQ